jgi:serine/threonine protein kinase
MSADGPISDLLLRWEELREQGQTVSAEELCRDCPELAEEVRRRIEALEAVYRVPNRPPAETQAEAAPRPAFAPPRVPGYEVLGLLGSGGMGVVYKARHLKLNRLVALKMILAGPHAGPEEVARFRGEAEAVARLQHPNVVQIYEVGEHDGRPYLALEYVDGGSLADRLGGKPQPADEAARLVRALALAVHAAHQHGVVHRDLKPANILLHNKSEIRNPKFETNSNPEIRNKPETPDPKPGGGGPGLGLRLGIEDLGLIVSNFGFRISDFEPKITDFGLAKRLDEAGQTQTGAVLGTPSYMAPEQAGGDRHGIGPHTDVHALGAILYELLTGRPPFEGSTLLETLEQVRGQEPLPATTLRPDLPRDLDTICRKCLEKEPARRYASALALADDLGRYLNGELIQARRFTLADRLARTLNRDQELQPFHALWRRLWPAPLLMSPVPFLLHLVPFLLLRGTPAYPLTSLGVTLVFFTLTLVVFLWVVRPGTLWWRGRVGHGLWATRLGHFAGMWLVPLVCWELLGPDDGRWALASYPLWALLTGLMFFALGGAFWGRLYLAGVAFFAVAVVMPMRLEWAPVELGLALSGLVVSATLHLRRTVGQAPGAAPDRDKLPEV